MSSTSNIERTAATDPVQAAAHLWAGLMRHQPGVAAALAVQLRLLPGDWPLRLFGVGRSDAALGLPSTPPGTVPEIAPVEPGDMETCPACEDLIEADQITCRFHTGFTVGYVRLHQPMIEAVKVDPAVTVHTLLQRLAEADEAEERGELADAVDHLLRDNSTPGDTEKGEEHP